MKQTKKEKLDAIIRLLQKEALNRRQLQFALGCTLHSVDKYIIELTAQKLIYVDYWAKTRSKPSPYYRAGNKLSATRPVAIDKKQYNKLYRERRQELQRLEQERQVEDPFVPRRDVAASWF